MKASRNVIEHIKMSEGCRLAAYRCPSGVWTVGYGHTGADVTPGLRITQAEADQLLAEDVARLEAELQRWMRIDGVEVLRQGQDDALVSLAFNTGMSALRGLTLWRKVKADVEDPTIATEFTRWTYGTRNGRKVALPGLVQRRARESRMWGS